MLRDMTAGFTKVISIAGAVVATLVVLAIIGMVNQHDKLSMNAVIDGFVDLLTWAATLASKLLAKL